MTHDELKNILYEVITLFPRSWKQALYAKICNNGKTYRHLLIEIDKATPLLDENYSIATKIYWILHDITSWNDTRVQCENCHKPFYFKKAHPLKGYTNKLCSRSCVASSPKVIELKQKNSFDRHGVKWWTNRKKAKETLQKHCKEDSNFINNSNSKRRETYKKHCEEDPSLKYRSANSFKKHCKEDPLFLPSVTHKIKESKKRNHNDENYNNQPKARRTFLKHFGVDHNMKSDIGKQAFSNSIKDKYGCDWPLQNYDIRCKGQKKYLYNGYKFDSSIELAFYIWLIDNNIKFKYQPDIKFKYSFNNKIHIYFPDFLVEGQLIELKGNHFFENKNPNNRMICPWDHTLDDLYEAKHQCMLQNNVKILTYNDYKKFIKYVNIKYGVKYLQQFKVNESR